MNSTKDTLFTPLFFSIFMPFALGYFVSVLLGSANAAMSPILVETFSLSPADLGFMTSVYLIAFGLAQFPIGVFLDRYGARKTLAPSLIFAVAGAFVFAFSNNMTSLVISRAISGIGLSGCLMAAFKAYAEKFPPERLPFIYSIQCLFGGIGGMAATKPILIAVTIINWRTLFIVLGFFTLFVAALIWFIVPKDEENRKNGETALFTLLRSMLAYFKDPRFILVAPVVTAAQSVMFAYLYLWISPWMRDVAGTGNSDTGMFMMTASAGAALGYFLNGVLADWLNKRGLFSWEKLYLYSGVFISLFLALIAVINGKAAALIWGPVMFLSTMSMISFPIIRRLYHNNEVGRVMSLLNFTIFLASFLLQWLVGVILNMYPVVGGQFSAEGHRICVCIIAAINMAAAIHLYFGLRRIGKI